MSGEFEELVSEVVDSAVDEYKERRKDGLSDRRAREHVDEYINETLDGHATVIYTQSAKEALIEAPDPFAYVEEFGADSFAEVCRNGDPWAVLLFMAASREVNNRLGKALDEAEEEIDEAEDEEDEEEAESISS